jgi:hypothetical protein
MHRAPQDVKSKGSGQSRRRTKRPVRIDNKQDECVQICRSTAGHLHRLICAVPRLGLPRSYEHDSVRSLDTCLPIEHQEGL